jgi:hypothetical protein
VLGERENLLGSYQLGQKQWHVIFHVCEKSELEPALGAHTVHPFFVVSAFFATKKRRSLFWSFSVFCVEGLTQAAGTKNWKKTS